MKIAVTSLGENLQSEVDPKFGRCHNFIIYDTETKSFETVNNENINAASGAGVQTGQFIVDNNVDVLITGNLGPKAASLISQTNVKVYRYDNGTVEQAIEDFKNGKLSEIN